MGKRRKTESERQIDRGRDEGRHACRQDNKNKSKMRARNVSQD